jgi:4-oxalocrotonate tautomerase
MPHVIVKLLPGRSAQQKAKIAEEVTKAIMATANCAETSVSVGIEDVASDDWTEQVYKPDILGKPDTLYKQPGYDPR